MFAWLFGGAKAAVAKVGVVAKEIGLHTVAHEAAGQFVKKKFEDIGKIRDARVALLNYLKVKMPDPVARKLLWDRYLAEDLKTRKGLGDENRLVALWIQIHDHKFSAEERDKIFEDLAYSDDVNFQAMLDLVDQNEFEQKFAKYRTKIGQFLEKEAREVDRQLDAWETWLDSKTGKVGRS